MKGRSEISGGLLFVGDGSVIQLLEKLRVCRLPLIRLPAPSPRGRGRRTQAATFPFLSSL